MYRARLTNIHELIAGTSYTYEEMVKLIGEKTQEYCVSLITSYFVWYYILLAIFVVTVFATNKNYSQLFGIKHITSKTREFFFTLRAIVLIVFMVVTMSFLISLPKIIGICISPEAWVAVNFVE